MDIVKQAVTPRKYLKKLLFLNSIKWKRNFQFSASGIWTLKNACLIEVKHKYRCSCAWNLWAIVFVNVYYICVCILRYLYLQLQAISVISWLFLRTIPKLWGILSLYSLHSLLSCCKYDGFSAFVYSPSKNRDKNTSMQGEILYEHLPGTSFSISAGQADCTPGWS